MSRPPQYPEFIEPGAPRWRRWWLGLGLLYGVQCALLLMLWPEAQPRLQLWLWSALLPLCWALVLAVRVLAWQIALFNRKVYLRTAQAATQRWWQQRSLGLPVQDVLLLGPAGDAQEHYLDLMKGVTPPAVKTDTTPCMLRCPLSLTVVTRARPGAGPASGPLDPGAARTAWLLAAGAGAGLGRGSKQPGGVRRDAGPGRGLVLPAPRLPLQDLTDLDQLIDTFHPTNAVAPTIGCCVPGWCR